MVYLQAIIIGSIVLFSAIVKSSFGFGFAVISSPLLLLFLPVQAVIGLIALYDLTTSFLVFAFSRKNIKKRIVIGLLLGMFIGTYMGVNFATKIDAATLKKLLGISLIVYASYRLLSSGAKIKLSKRMQSLFAPVFGLLAGISGGISNINGPPALIYLESALEKDMLRATAATIFFVDSLWRVLLFVRSGYITVEIFSYALSFLPVLLIGVFFGGQLFKRFSKESFTTAILFTLFVMGILLMVR